MNRIDKINDQKELTKVIVEAGLIWVGDPCYCLNREPERMFKSLGKDWGEFHESLKKGVDRKGFQSFGFDGGHEGVGICLRPGHGDGEYPVVGEYLSDGTCAGFRVVFIEDHLSCQWQPKEEDLLTRVSVDAGLIWVGDPCYWLHQAPEDRQFKTLGDGWAGFCEKLHEGGYNQKGYREFNFFPTQTRPGGLGVAIRTAHGDGAYPVYGRFGDDGSLVEVLIDFLED